MDAILSALLVIVRTPHIWHYLEQTEPKALEQALEAIEGLEADQQPRNSLVQAWIDSDQQADPIPSATLRSTNPEPSLGSMNVARATCR